MIGFENKRLTSEHLAFRVLEERDKKSLSQIVQEPETTIPAGFLPITDETGFEAFWEDLTRYHTGIAILLNEECIGYFHVHPWEPQSLEYRGKKNVMIGFLIKKDYLRRGYGAETLQTLTPYLLERFDCIWGDYFEGNVASQKLLAKCGFKSVDTYDMCFEALDGKTMRVYSNVLAR